MIGKFVAHHGHDHIRGVIIRVNTRNKTVFGLWWGNAHYHFNAYTATDDIHDLIILD